MLLEEQLGVGGRLRVGACDEPKPVAAGPTHATDEPTHAADEPTHVADDEPTLEVGTEYLDEVAIRGAELRAEEPPDDSRESSSAAVELPHSNDFDIPDFRRHQIGPPTFFAIVAAVILVMGGVIRHQSVDRSAGTSNLANPQAPKKTEPQPPPERRSPEPTRSSTALANGESVESSGLREQEFGRASPDIGSTAVTVTVKVIPADTVIFRAGEKLGTGAVRVSVARGAKQRLTALHDGYVPFNFTLDGSRDTLTVRLTAVPRPHATPATVSDSPFEGRESTNVASSTSSPAPAARASVAEPVPSPDTSAGATPLE